MFRPCKVIINLELEHFKKNIKTANARNKISFLQILSHIFHAVLEEQWIGLNQ
jgi:hypothetical protein